MNILSQIAGLLNPNEIGFFVLDANTVLGKVLNLFYFITGVAAVIVIIVAGYYFTVGGNNPSTVSRAKNAILYAVIGLVIVISAFAITNYITGNFK